MPRKGTKSQNLVDREFRKLAKNPPVLKTRGGVPAQRRQLQAIAISNARKAGARVPKKRKT